MEGDVDKDNVITRTNLGVVQSSADEMDARRRNTAVLDYLCKLDDAKEWVGSRLGKQIELQAFLEELPKGEWLADIAVKFDTSNRVRIHRSQNREYMHTDNINIFLGWLKKIKLSRHFLFEVIDLYESKNIPKVVYAIHGLAHFLKVRGITPGIERRQNVVFTQEEQDLVANDIHNIGNHRYEEIQNNLDSDEYNGEAKNKVNESSRTQTESIVEENQEIENKVPEAGNETYEGDDEELKVFDKTYMWRKAFNSIISNSNISLYALRKYISSDFNTSGKYKKLQQIQLEIVERFKANHRLQSEKDSIIRTARLFLENQARLRGIPYQEFPLANDYRLFKRALYAMIHDPVLVSKIIRANYEFPLRTIFADNIVGDYFFSRFLEKQMGNKPEMIKIASKHFVTSKVFSNMSRLFESSSSFDLNPVRISEIIHSRLPKVDPLNKFNKRAMMDEAVKDKAVRDEIVRRCHEIMEFVTPRLDYILNMELPYYVRMFVGESGFFESFIEPAIILSKNFIICEIVKYIFYEKHLFESKSLSFEQERLFYYDCKFDKTTNLDFSDYSPLKDYLESDANRSFRGLFVAKNTPAPISQHFRNCVADGQCLQVEISLEEVNSLIIILKKNMKHMSESLKNIVSEMVLLRENPFENEEESDVNKTALKRCSQTVDVTFKNQRQAAPITNSQISDLTAVTANGEKEFNSESQCQRIDESGIHSSRDNYGGNPSEDNQDEMSQGLNSDKSDCQSEDFKKERFVLKLDTQFIESFDESESALLSLIRDLKSRLLLMISISTRKDFVQILHTSTQEEYEKFESFKDSPDNKIYVGFPGNLDLFKKQVLDDLEFLESKKIVTKTNGYADIIQQIVMDILDHRFDMEDEQLEMNTETLDALFKKGIILKEDLKILHSYLKSLCSSMALNKSGMLFNKQFGAKTKYGSYKYRLSELNPRIYEDVSLENLEFIISMDDPMVVDIRMLCSGTQVLSLEKIRFDELLRLQEDGIKYFEAGDLCALSVGSIVELINTQYIRY